MANIYNLSMKILLVFLLFLSACQTLGLSDADKVETEDELPRSEVENEAKDLEESKSSVSELYNSAQDLLEQRKYKKAAEEFIAVEQEYPYSEWAVRAQVQAAYANYKEENYDGAIGILDRFIRQNPGDENVPYSYYLIALSYYNQIANVERDQGITNQAKKALSDVVARFPDSTYARDSKFKLDLVEDHLAGKELAVGRYYLRNRQYIGAINRFKEVVENYQATAQVEEALHRLVEAYLALGVIPEAQKYAAVLGHNYPGSEWYQDSYDLLIDGEFASDDGGDSWYEIF